MQDIFFTGSEQSGFSAIGQDTLSIKYQADRRAVLPIHDGYKAGTVRLGVICHPAAALGNIHKSLTCYINGDFVTFFHRIIPFTRKQYK